MLEVFQGEDLKGQGENMSAFYDAVVESVVKVATLHWVPESVLTVNSGGSANAHLQKMDQAMRLSLSAPVEADPRAEFPQT